LRTLKEKIKIGCKDLTELAFFPAFRAAERLLPAERFYALLKPSYQARATLNKRFKKSKFGALPDFLEILKTTRAVTEQRRAFYLNQIVDYFPDRLAQAKWRGRCQIDGLGHLQAAQQNRRPVVLAFCHFGPYPLLRSWLRAAGFPAIILMGGKTAERTRIRRFMDRYMPWPNSPPTLFQDRWHEVGGYLKAGNPLLVAVDVPRGKQINVPFCEGWSFQMASGAVRLAIRHQADLISCNIIDEGAWKFRIRLGAPVPKEYLASDADWFRAGKHLMDEMLPDFHAHPEQCLNDLIRCLKSTAPAPILNPCIPAS
jgi:lauroyl/myristoyl acyltransferase